MIGDPLDGRQTSLPQDPRRQLKPAKDTSTERVDGILALVVAIGRTLVDQEECVTTPLAI